MSSEDTNAVLENFKSTLDGLTFNSRPIITTLTQLAEEHMNLAREFVELIETRLEKCVPSQKLFTFYVMDSICKNAGSPYTIYFSKNLHKLFRKAYLLVDNQTRTKMISMFKTWIVPLPAGDLMFDQKSLDSIEQFLIKASALHQKSSTPQVAPQALPAPSITVKSLLAEIDKLSLITQSKLINDSGDGKLQAKVAILKQLKLELQKEQLSVDFLAQIQQQLRQIFAQENQQLDQSQFPAQHPNSQQLQKQNMQMLPSIQNRPTQALDASNSNIYSSQNTNNSGSMFGGSLQFNAPFLQQLTNSNKINKLSALVKRLKEKDLIHEPREDSIVTLANKLEAELESSNKVELPSYSLLQDILGDIGAQRQIQNVDLLNSTFLQLSQQFVLNDNHPITQKLTNFLYRAKPKKCTTCGKRFGNGPLENELEIRHLDWHFRVNKKIKGIQSNVTTSTKVIQSRNWYLDESQWVDFKDEEIISTDLSTSAAEQQPTFEDKKDDSREKIYSKLKEKYVVVPDFATDMKFQCPICTESTYGKHDEDLGEWIWTNCIQVADKFFHATCYYEAAKNQQSNTSSSSQNLQLDFQKLNELVN